MNFDHLTRKELEDRLRHFEMAYGSQGPYSHVPPVISEEFNSVSQRVQSYFQQIKFNPEQGSIEIENERYILIRAAALSSDFFEIVTKLYADQSPEQGDQQVRNFLFDIAHVIGTEDARILHKKLNLLTPTEKLSAGPVHFALTGWAFVHILPESNPVPNKQFFLKYQHPYSFEADSWIKKGIQANEPVCVMNAAYSAAWCSESFGLELSAVELSCRACGDDSCTFIMAPKDQITSYLKRYQHSKEGETFELPPLFFERKKIEEKLRSSEQMLKEAQRMAKIGSWQFDLITHDLQWSDELYAIFELDKSFDGDLYQTYLSKIPPDDLNRLNSLIEHTLKTGEIYQIQHTIIASDSKMKWVWCTGIPVINQRNEIVGLKGIIQDITEKLVLQMELNSFFEMSVDLLCIANDQGYFLKISPSWSKLLGYTEEELCAVPFVHFVHPEDIQQTIEETNNLNNGELSLRFENRYRKKDGEYVTLSWNAMINPTNGLIYATARDISDQKEKEAKLQLNIQEKEILLKEIHHRVKNNLQIISSLLSLQAKMNRKNDKLIRLYEDSMNRINSMAALHELFYQSENLQRIDFAEYLTRLTHDLTQTFKGQSSAIQLKIDVVPTFLTLDTAVPLGLIVNEILTNTFKHAFGPDEHGIITVRLTKNTDGDFTLSIGDNGKGFNPENQLESAETLGLSLIHDLTEQLDGKVHLNTQKGTHYSIQFREQ